MMVDPAFLDILTGQSGHQILQADVVVGVEKAQASNYQHVLKHQDSPRHLLSNAVAIQLWGLHDT